jgi:hypothetical protein
VFIPSSFRGPSALFFTTTILGVDRKHASREFRGSDFAYVFAPFHFSTHDTALFGISEGLLRL